jgi:hypothetical protein
MIDDILAEFEMKLRAIAATRLREAEEEVKTLKGYLENVRHNCDVIKRSESTQMQIVKVQDTEILDLKVKLDEAQNECGTLRGNCQYLEMQVRNRAAWLLKEKNKIKELLAILA